MDLEEFRIFEYVITRLDLFYIEWVHEQMKSDKQGMSNDA